jgi:hypothetical protein
MAHHPSRLKCQRRTVAHPAPCIPKAPTGLLRTYGPRLLDADASRHPANILRQCRALLYVFMNVCAASDTDSIGDTLQGHVDRQTGRGLSAANEPTTAATSDPTSLPQTRAANFVLYGHPSSLFVFVIRRRSRGVPDPTTAPTTQPVPFSSLTRAAPCTVVLRGQPPWRRDSLSPPDYSFFFYMAIAPFNLSFPFSVRRCSWNQHSMLRHALCHAVAYNLSIRPSVMLNELSERHLDF